jgi:hypothetical protein
MSEALFYHPTVRKVIRAVLVSKGIRAEPDLEDAINEVVLACIEYVHRTGRPPKDVAEAAAIARRIASADGIDAARGRRRRSKSNQGLTGDADAHAPERSPSVDPVDQGRMLAAVRPALTPQQLEALADVGAGVAQAQLAAESGTSPAAMRKRVQASREKALRALAAKGYLVAGGFAALLAGMMLLHLGPWSGPHITGHAPSPIGRAEELAAEQRRLAAVACSERNWDACAKALDRAAGLDAKSERRPDVTALREAIAAGRRGSGAGDVGAEDR